MKPAHIREAPVTTNNKYFQEMLCKFHMISFLQKTIPFLGHLWNMTPEHTRNFQYHEYIRKEVNFLSEEVVATNFQLINNQDQVCFCSLLARK
jgi:hypothetical protein